MTTYQPVGSLKTMSPQVKDPQGTRSKILGAAMECIHLNGFQGTSINDIVAKAGITKGALFYHFKGKMELGYAVVDEIVKSMILDSWVKPLSNNTNPIEAIINIVDSFADEIRNNQEMLNCGCPLGNLAQEMSPLDEGFRVRLHEVYELWKQAVAQAFETGKTAGMVRPDIDSMVTASFIVAALEGMMNMIKCAQSLESAVKAKDGLYAYLHSLENS